MASDAEMVERGPSRRQFLARATGLAALGAMDVAARPFGRALAAPRAPSADVAIVGVTSGFRAAAEIVKAF